MTAPRSQGAVALKPRKKPLGWLVPVAILLLILLAAGVTLLLLNANDNGDDPGVDLKDDPASITYTP